jgi:hypothetical protein
MHAWSLTVGRTAFSAHLSTEPSRECAHELTLLRAQTLLAGKYGIQHNTLQIETRDTCPAHGAPASQAGVEEGAGVEGGHGHAHAHAHGGTSPCAGGHGHSH